MVSQGRGTGGGGWTPPSPREVKTCTCSKGLLFSPSSLTSKERWSGGKVGVGGIVTGNGARSLVIRLQRSLTLMRPSFPPVSGLSFGIISGVFSVINILADALGPGVVGIHGDSPYYFLTSGKICFLPCLHAPSIPGPDLIYWSSLGDFFGSASQEAGSR